MPAGQLFFKKIGQGQKNLVFVHGLLGFWRNFYTISKAFEESYACLLYDQRGHGDSPHYSSYKIEEFAQDLKRLLESLNLNSVNLVGHSLGGYVSSYFAYKEPQLVKKLILVDTCPWPQEERVEEILRLLKNLPDQFESREAAKTFFDKLTQNKKLSQMMAFFLTANLEKKTAGAVKFRFDKEGLLSVPQEVRKLDYPFFLKSLNIPILCLRGEFSRHFSKSDFEKTKSLNPLIQTIKISASGHWLHAQQPKKVIKTIKDFLNQ